MIILTITSFNSYYCYVHFPNVKVSTETLSTKTKITQLCVRPSIVIPGC